MSEGIVLRVRLTPRGGRGAVEGFADDADGNRVLQVRVAEPPADNAANEALVRLIARTLGVPRSAVCIASGAKARLKRLRIDGDPAALAARLKSLGPEPSGRAPGRGR